MKALVMDPFLLYFLCLCCRTVPWSRVRDNPEVANPNAEYHARLRVNGGGVDASIKRVAPP